MSPPDAERVLVLNPQSGTGDHVERVRSLAAAHGFEVRETERGGDAVELARTAHDAALVAAAGGDGTLNEVVYGLWQAGALDDVDVAVIPAGTGNNFAGNVGVTGVEQAFDVVEGGERRALDLAVTAGAADTVRPTVRPFVNSCVGGVTADASVETTSEAKRAYGTVAYALNALRSAAEFDGLPVSVRTSDEIERTWEGSAACVFVGNGRRFAVDGETQAHVEDGLLEVTIVEDHPTAGLAGDAALSRLLGSEMEHVVRLRTPALALELSGERAAFSLDGEVLAAERLSIETRRNALRVAVGEGYDPDPGYPAD